MYQCLWYDPPYNILYYDLTTVLSSPVGNASVPRPQAPAKWHPHQACAEDYEIPAAVAGHVQVHRAS